MAVPNSNSRDPITSTGAHSGSGSVTNTSAGKIKSISGGGPNFTSNPGSGKGHSGSGWPVPDSPYK